MTQRNEKKQEQMVTSRGNPAKPEGEDGRRMLERMNQSHFEVTGWGLGFWQIRESDKILDIGCGGGATLHRMAESIVSGHLTGVDYSAVSVETSRKNNAKEISEGKMQILEGTVEHLPFEDEFFDKIVTVESFYFWPDPQENLREVLRVLKTEGTFLLIADIYQKEDLEQQILDNVKRYHLFNPTREEFLTYFKTAGFHDIRIHTKEGEHWICVEGHKKSADS